MTLISYSSRPPSSCGLGSSLARHPLRGGDSCESYQPASLIVIRRYLRMSRYLGHRVELEALSGKVECREPSNFYMAFSHPSTLATISLPAGISFGRDMLQLYQHIHRTFGFSTILYPTHAVTLEGRLVQHLTFRNSNQAIAPV